MLNDPDIAANFSNGRLEDPARRLRDALRDAIIDRRLAPGTKLSEAEVGKLFDVSRTVVRAALQALVAEALVRTERNRGAFVANPGPEEAAQVFAARRLIEAETAAQAAARLTPDQIIALDRHLELERELTTERGPQARRTEIKASGTFHRLIASAAGNGVLARFLDELIARSSLVIALYGRSGASSCGHCDHAAIAAALAEGDGLHAATLVRRHIDHIEADLDLRGRAGLALRDALEL